MPYESSRWGQKGPSEVPGEQFRGVWALEREYLHLPFGSTPLPTPPHLLGMVTWYQCHNPGPHPWPCCSSSKLVQKIHNAPQVPRSGISATLPSLVPQNGASFPMSERASAFHHRPQTCGGVHQFYSRSTAVRSERKELSSCAPSQLQEPSHPAGRGGQSRATTCVWLTIPAEGRTDVVRPLHSAGGWPRVWLKTVRSLLASLPFDCGDGTAALSSHLMPNTGKRYLKSLLG